MIYSVTGLPGEGKTCFAVQHIILNELMQGDRVIWSNIEWHKKKVIEFCDDFGYQVDPRRLKKIPEEHIQSFWTFCSKNSLIVLDEVAECFNAHAWKEIGTEAGSWARQHRKLGQETYLVVQDQNHIYKQFRDLIATEIQIVNLSNKKLFGFFCPKMFVAKWYLKGQPHKPIQNKTYFFNTKVFAVYDTMATVGGVLETRGEIKCKSTKQKNIGFVTKLRRKAVEIAQDNWYTIIGLCLVGAFISFIIFAPRLLSGQMTKPVDTSILEKVKNEKENIPINTSVAKSFSNNKSFEYDVGRYDSTDKRRP
jgi:hypothetical protein